MILNRLGKMLYTNFWDPTITNENNNKCVMILHGITEHCHLYDHVAKKLNDEGFRVFSFDQQGHGRSEGERLYVNSFNDLINDTNDMIEYVGLLHNDIYLLGHSLGGLIALFINDPRVKKKVLSAPATTNIHLDCFNYIMNPKWKIITMYPEYLTDDERLIDMMKNDPLQKDRTLPWNTINELMKAVRKIPKIENMVHIFHGNYDSVISIGSSYSLQEVYPTRVVVYELEGKPHDFLMNRFDHQLSEILDEILDIMNKSCDF